MKLGTPCIRSTKEFHKEPSNLSCGDGTTFDVRINQKGETGRNRNSKDTKNNRGILEPKQRQHGTHSETE